MGIVTPQELFLFTDSARSTISPKRGAPPELVDLESQKAWKIGRVIFAQAGLRTIAIHGKDYDFTGYARNTLRTRAPFDPARFCPKWNLEMRHAIRLANDESPSNFAELVHNGVKGVEIVLGWFDSQGMPHLKRMYIGIQVSTDGKLVMEDHDSETLLPGSGEGSTLLGAEAADIAPELVSDQKAFTSLRTLMGEGLYEKAATLIITYAAKRFPEVGGPVRMVSLLRDEHPLRKRQ